MNVRQHSGDQPTSTDGADEALIEQLDRLAQSYGNRFLTEPAPDNQLPKHGMRSVEAMRLVSRSWCWTGSRCATWRRS